MPMLTLDWIAADLVDRYSGFASSLTWYRMYCAAKFGKNKKDYLDGFQSLKSAYEHLWDADEQIPAEWRIKPTITLIGSIETILKSTHLTDDQIGRIASLIRNFQENEQSAFKDIYVKEQVAYDLKKDYPVALYDAVVGLLENDNTDEAIITAFKFLDNHLQRLTSASPYQFYGEELINHAFAPKSGVLQIGTDPNEQIGLRNFFSGATALFRNPVAHRFMKHELFFTACIVAMVSAMSEIATQIAGKNSGSVADYR